mgnify:CR=1 FL=1
MRSLSPSSRSEPWQNWDFGIASILVLATVLAAVVLRRTAGLWGALGSDAALWGLTARDLTVGAPPIVPPLYPLIVSGFQALGLPLVDAGWHVSTLSHGLLVGLVWYAARTLGTPRSLALIAAIATALLPDLATWAQQVQPDSTAAMALLLWAILLVHAPTSPKHALGAAIVAGLLPALRAHGLVAIPLTVLVFLTSIPRGWKWCLPMIAWWMALPIMLGVSSTWNPLGLPWSDRTNSALSALTTHDAAELPYLRELTRVPRSEYIDLLEKRDLTGRLLWHIQRSLSGAWSLWLLILATVVLVWRRHRSAWILTVPFATALPALFIWSQRRHVALLVPIAIVAIVATIPHLSFRGKTLAKGCFLAWTCIMLTTWPTRIANQQSERYKANHFAQAATIIAEANATMEPPSKTPLLGGLYQDIGLYQDLPRHDPDGTDADWHTYWVATQPPPDMEGDRWTEISEPIGELRIYRLAPDRVDRPCADGSVQSTTPHVVRRRAHAEMTGCDSE